MADSFNEGTIEDAPAAPTAGDVEMGEGAAAENANDSELPFAEDGPDGDAPSPRITFVQYLSSPVVTLLVGSGENETILTAHQGLLMQSPYFAAACAEFANDGSVCLSSSLGALGWW